MDKQQKQIIITSVLIIIMIFAWANTFKKIKNRSGNKASVSAPASITPVLQPPETKPEQDVFVSKDEEGLKWVRCPFSGEIYSVREGTSSELRLEGILWDQDYPQAIINSRVVGIGDSIAAYEVVDIKKDKVILSDGLSMLELKLGR